MSPENPSAQYQSYLLRLWRDAVSDPWRASLQSTKDGSERQFASAELAWIYLQKRMARGDGAEIDTPDASE